MKFKGILILACITSLFITPRTCIARWGMATIRVKNSHKTLFTSRDISWLFFYWHIDTKGILFVL